MQWFQDVWLQLNKIEDISGSLFEFSEALKVVGLERLAIDLQDISKSCITSSKSIRAIIAKKIDSDLKLSEESSKNILNATLAGIELQKRDCNET